MIDTDTLLVLLDGEVIPLMANARIAFVKLNEYEYCRFQNIWYRRRHSEKTRDEPVFMPMYNWISARR